MCVRSGLVIIICAPSGAGKSTLINFLLKDFPEISFSISYTTRAARYGEQHGREYFFVSKEDFLSLRAADFFAESAEVHGNYYGTSKEQVSELLTAGKDVLFDIDIQGAELLRKHYPNALYIFILPPSKEELATRLYQRKTDSEESILHRLENAEEEIKKALEFSYILVNNDLKKAYEGLSDIYKAAKSSVKFNKQMWQEQIDRWGK